MKARTEEIYQNLQYARHPTVGEDMDHVLMNTEEWGCPNYDAGMLEKVG